MENLNEKLEEKRKAEAAKAEEEKKIKDEAAGYVSNFKPKYIAMRIRDGYIGKELSKDGRVLQPYRSCPRGTMVAFKDPEDENILRIGITYLKNGEKDVPIEGIASAIKYALNENKGMSMSYVKNGIKIMSTISNHKLSYFYARDMEQFDFFKIRALCYFYPDIFSHSRGSDKIEYPNYEKIHENRKKILGE